MSGLNPHVLLRQVDAQDVRACSDASTHHPHTEVVHVALEHLTSEELSNESCDCDNRALHPSPSIEECEGRTGKSRSKSIREPSVQGLDAFNLVKSLIDVFDKNLCAFNCCQIVCDAINSISIDTQETLLSKFGTESTIRIGCCNDLSEGHLSVVLFNANRLGAGAHRGLDAVGTSTSSKKHLSQAQNNSGLVGQTVMRSHAMHGQ